jgi:PhoH-like ATPase
MAKIIVDTNVLIDFPNIITENPNDTFIIHSIVAEELDDLIHNKKNNSDLSYKARVARDQILTNQLKNIELSMERSQFALPSSWDTNKNDNILLSFSKDKQSSNSDDFYFLYTNDLLMQMKAKFLGIIYKGYDGVGFGKKSESNYTGYKEIVLDDDELAKFYEKHENNFSVMNNQYLVIKNENNEIVDKYKYTSDNGFKKVKYNTIDSRYVGKVKPRNLQQELYLDMLNDKNTKVKVCTGGYGSGKDYLALATFLTYLDKDIYKKIIWIRNNIEAHDTAPIGFLKGNLTEKLSVFAEIVCDFVGDKIGFEMLLNSGKLELVHAGFLRGRDFRDSIIYCTEAQNMSVALIQLIISRVSDNSIIFFNGDTKQIDNEKFKVNNGLDVMISKFTGHSEFGYIKLEKCERSNVATMAGLLD